MADIKHNDAISDRIIKVPGIDLRILVTAVMFV